MLGTEFCHVLALSGGGYRGLFTVRVLKLLEQKMGGSIMDHFQVITGTSIGGIIALALAAGISLERLEKVFLEEGMNIFPSSPKSRNLFDYMLSIFRPIHDASGLRSVLTKLFEERLMGDLNQAYAVVPAANLTTGKPKMFKTPHAKELYLDAKLPVVEVALAISAAPVYFPIHRIEHLRARFADGALVGNAPGLFGWLEAQEYLGYKKDDITVLAIGTLAGAPNVSSEVSLRQGALFWMCPKNLRLLKFLMSQQEYLADFMLSRLMDDRYAIIDTTVSEDSATDIELDDTSRAAQDTLIARAENEFSMFLRTDFFKTHIENDSIAASREG